MFRSTLAFFERHLGAAASERFPRPAIDERRMTVLNKLVEPRGEPAHPRNALSRAVVGHAVFLPNLNFNPCPNPNPDPDPHPKCKPYPVPDPYPKT